MNAKGLKRITELSVEKADAVKGGAGCSCTGTCSCASDSNTAKAKSALEKVTVVATSGKVPE